MTYSSRYARLEALAEQPEVPVLIVGGGVNGIGTFRDLAHQGVDVLLVERGDFCGGASAASSHMAHGGIRYLENGEFRLVSEALLERNRLLRNSPHNVKPLPTTIPIFKVFSGLFNAPLKFLGLMDRPAERGALVIKIGLIFYDWYARRLRVMPTHRMYGRAESQQRHPGLHPDVRYTARYYDGYMPCPERICIELMQEGEAAHPGAAALNYVSMLSAEGATVTLRDEITGRIFNVRPKVLINAAGPWIDLANQTMGLATHFIGGTKGSHLILDHPRLRAAIGDDEIFFENKDGRIVLMLPFFERVMAGTTDIRIENPDDARCTEEEVEYILGMIERVFPDMQVDRSHIKFQFTGVRPLPTSRKGFTGNVSRDHHVEVVNPGAGLDFPVLSLVGGKWTSFRAFSEQTTDRTLELLGLPRISSTADMPFGGGVGYPHNEAEKAAWLDRVADETGVPHERLTMLFETYGTNAEKIARFIAQGKDMPITGLETISHREIMCLAQQEHVEHLDDVLLRRSTIAMRGLLTPAVLEALAHAVGEGLGWDNARIQEEVERSKKYLKEHHAVTL